MQGRPEHVLLLMNIELDSLSTQESFFSSSLLLVQAALVEQAQRTSAGSPRILDTSNHKRKGRRWS